MADIPKSTTSKKKPEGWELGWRVGMLCPECHEEYDKLIKDFMEEANVKA